MMYLRTAPQGSLSHSRLDSTCDPPARLAAGGGVVSQSPKLLGFSFSALGSNFHCLDCIEHGSWRSDQRSLAVVEFESEQAFKSASPSFFRALKVVKAGPFGSRLYKVDDPGVEPALAVQAQDVAARTGLLLIPSNPIPIPAKDLVCKSCGASVPTRDAGQPQRATFSSALAERFVGRQVERRLIGGPYVRVGPLLTVCAYLLQVGGTLGRAFRAKPLPFLTAFASSDSSAERVLEFVCGDALKSIVPVLPNAESFLQLAVEISKPPDLQAIGWSEWMMKYGSKRRPAKDAFQQAVLFSIYGAGLGLKHPAQFERLFEGTYHRVSEESWQEAARFGVVDAGSQPDVSLQETERESVAEFSEFCQEFYPEVIAELGSTEGGRDAPNS